MDRLIVIIEPLLRFFLIATLIVVVFLFLIRPLLSYLLINKEIEQKKRLLAELKEINSVEEEDDSYDYNEDTVDHLSPAKSSKGKSNKETLAKLAESNPEKAGDLVKKWVNSE